MKQILHSFETGQVELVDVPDPSAGRGYLLVRTAVSLLSSGTERMLLEFGRASYLDKARQQPDKVKQVLDKVRTDGLLSTVHAVRSKLSQPIPLGYCNAGIVIAVGEGVEGFSVGDRVVSNGPHASLVRVPQNLCARIPDAVELESAAFTVVASIGLQGIRLAQPTLGERFVVTGLGLIGLLTVQLLRANGCAVLGLDFDPHKLALAQRLGAEVVELSAGADPVAAALAFSQGQGVDGVLITAATKSNEPVHQAAQMCRKRGRIVLVGVTGLELQRSDFYEKELSFHVSCSYGPGRYDASYEEQGLDYPFGLVRWTEQRNFEAVLQLLAQRQLQVDDLISHRFPFDDAIAAYDLLGSSEPSIAILLDYPPTPSVKANSQPDERSHAPEGADQGGPEFSPTGHAVVQHPSTPTTPTLSQTLRSWVRPKSSAPALSVIGAGNFAMATMLPVLASSGARRRVLADANGTAAFIGARSFGFAQSASDAAHAIEDPESQAVFVLTRHDTHPDLVLRCLEAGKHVYVEKPLAIDQTQLERVAQACAQHPERIIMLGFNRRFAPLLRAMLPSVRALSEPVAMVYTVNAGFIPPAHWLQQRQLGGGRIIGEACHFIDLLRFLAGSAIAEARASALRSSGSRIYDTVSIDLRFANGSIGTVHYLSNGHKGFPKERIELFGQGKVLQLDNFRRLSGFGISRLPQLPSLRQDKGHAASVAAFLASLASGVPPIPFEEIEAVRRVSIRLADELEL